MLQEDNTNPKEAWHPFSDLVLAVEGKAGAFFSEHFGLAGQRN